MKKKHIKGLAFIALSISILLVSCNKNNDLLSKSGAIADKASLALGTGAYSNGFFLVNEGWYGHGTGEVNFYSYGTAALTDSIFAKANPGKNLNPATSTLEFGTIFNGNLYLVSKVGGPLVVTDENTLVETGRIAAASGRDWRAFVGVDATHGLVSSQTGIYPLSLPSLTIGTKLSGTAISGQVGDLIKSGNHIFALSQSAGLVIIDASADTIVSTLSGITVGFAKTADSAVWCAGGTSLVRIDPLTLATTSVTLPFTVNGSWYAWHPGSIAASTAQNAVFIANNATYTGGTTIYKYIVGSPSSLTSPFITIATGKALYGAGMGYDASNNTLVVTTVQSGGGTNYSVNDLDIYNAGTGVLNSDLGYTGYWFPALPVFH